MKNSPCAVVRLVLPVSLLVAGPGAAADKPLIWEPAKVSDTSYSVKLGLRLPMQLEPEAGFDLGLNTSKSGAPVGTPVRFWSNFKAQEIQRPAYELKRDVGLQLDGNARTAAITLNAYEKHIATPKIDVEREGTLAVRYDAAGQHWSGVDVSQSLRIAETTTGTTFVVRASASDSFRTTAGGIGLEQSFGPHMTVTGGLDRSSDTDSAAASINASYRFTW